jgi:hypothetical protein
MDVVGAAEAGKEDVYQRSACSSRAWFPDTPESTEAFETCEEF